ncbi:MAG TPA: hypothetical protein DCW29_10400 [Janthinobacterium sp.]|nr:hypothetical protein [Janthinobacterium sp.]
MIAMRSLLKPLRVLGVLAMALALYAWMYPASLEKWIGAAGVAGVTPAPQGQAATSAGGGSAAAPPASGTAKPIQVSVAQATMAQWLGNKYRVSPSAIAALIVEADKLSKQYRLSPNLIIAVMAIESNFHPYIQSEAGAQGLMQVMPLIHAKRYEKFGGKSSFIDPFVSLKVGAEILRDCTKLKGGSETEALRFYFGGGASSDLYIDKVRTEQHRLNQVAAGQHVPVN